MRRETAIQLVTDLPPKHPREPMGRGKGSTHRLVLINQLDNNFQLSFSIIKA
jgi:hypothetical protein